MKNLFFDYNSTTPVREEVLRAMLPYFSEDFGNPSSVHRRGQVCRDAVELARRRVARVLGVTPEEIIFTSGGSEANTTALIGTAFNHLDAKGHIIISSIEHPSVSRSASFLESIGFMVSRIDPDSTGVLEPGRIEDALREDTFLISVMHSNNETGALQPVEQIASIARRRGITFHTDAIQSAGKIRIDFHGILPDLLSLSAHKFYGPKGTGALCMRKKVKLSPIVFGGGQERGMRGGTENVPQIAGMGISAELAMQEVDGFQERISKVRDAFEKAIMNEIEDVAINARNAPRLPNTSSIVFRRVSAQFLMISLDLKGVAVSMGSACHSGTVEPSQVLLVMGLSREDALSAIRISFGRNSGLDDALFLAKLIKDEVAHLRAGRKDSRFSQ